MIKRNDYERGITMKLKLSLFAVMLVLSMILAACGGNEEAEEEQSADRRAC